MALAGSDENSGWLFDQSFPPFVGLVSSARNQLQSVPLSSSVSVDDLCRALDYRVSFLFA